MPQDSDQGTPRWPAYATAVVMTYGFIVVTYLFAPRPVPPLTKASVAAGALLGAYSLARLFGAPPISEVTNRV